MKFQPNTVAADLPHDGIAVFLRMIVNGLRHISQKIPGLHLLQSNVNTFLRHLHKPACFLRYIPKHKHTRGVGKIAFIYSRYIHIDNIAILKKACLIRYAVTYHLVNGSTDTLRKSLVIKRRGNTSQLLCHIPDNPIYLFRTHAHMNLSLNLIQNRNIQFTAFPDSLQLFRRL